MKPAMITDGERERLLRAFLTSPAIGRRRAGPEALGRYHCALTHRSYTRETGVTSGDNERLEFLGDRVLNLIVAEFLFRNYPGQEGDLTARMEWTENRNLARAVAAANIGFEDLILVGSRQEKTPRIIAGAFEAFVAALYLDLGLARTKTIIGRLMSDEIRNFRTDRNYKKILQEYLQKRDHPLPEYHLEERTGAHHHPRFSYVVMIDGAVIGRGKGRSKAEATQNAAREALQVLQGSRPA
ncbi:MAG: ribonuclease III [Methanomicrobiales archaeon]|nr:ribonuclease III [Methanomicrobiales archaeon]